MHGISRCTDRPPRSQCGLSSLQIVDFFLLLPTVGSIRGRTARSASAATGRRLIDPSFFVHISWCCPIGVCSSHVDFRHLNSSGEFRFSISHHSHPMLHGVVLTRCSELSSVVGSSHVPSLTAPLWFASGHSLGNAFDVISVRPSSVEMALSQFYGRGFCLDRGKIRDSSTCVFLRSVVPSLPALFSGLKQETFYLQTTFLKHFSLPFLTGRTLVMGS